MQTFSIQPLGFSFNFATENNFNFAIDSVFTSNANVRSGSLPPGNTFLLLDNTGMRLLNNSFLLLL